MTTIYQVSEDDLMKVLEKVQANEFWSAKTAAERLDISPKTIRKWADQGVIKRYYFPKHKMPGITQMVRFKVDELLAAGGVDPEI